MSEAQALSEARRRWGGEAHVTKSGKGWFQVGTRKQSQFDVKGESTLSWEEAFRDADRRVRS